MLPDSVKNISSDGVDLLHQMLVYDPSKRINARDALQHCYFKNLDKTTLPTLPEIKF